MSKRSLAGSVLACALAWGVYTSPVLAASTPDAKPAATATFPTRQVRIVVGFPPGSSVDMMARFLGTNLTERFGQQVLIDNRPGANGILAAEFTTKQPADGHTMLLISISHTMNAAVRKMPFDPVNAFAPITTLGSGPLVLVTHPSLPVNNVKQLIALAAAKPGALNYAVAGTGGINHFSGALFAHMAKVKMTHVPYKGGAQALTEVIGGQVEMMFGTAALSVRQVRAGRLKALGVTAMQRSPLLPETPTIAEAGVPGYDISSWWGMVAPAGTPAPIIGRLNSEIAAILKQPELAQRLEADGAIPSSSTSEALGQRLVTEVEKWKQVARAADIRAD